MSKRFFSLAILLALALGFVAPTTAEEATHRPAQALPKLEHVAIETSLGTITLALDATNAPITVANFLRYADEKRFDGTAFYRVMRLDWGTPPNGLIQAGTSGAAKRNLPPIAHEPTSQTGILHLAGTISMARFDPGTAAGDFSILLSPQPGLNAQPEAEDPSTRVGFAAFGQVVAGMDVVRAIYDVPLSTTEGVGFLKGQMIEDPVKIRTVRRSAPPLPVPQPTADTGPADAP
ncbi:MAG: peptidylprolyl isomerase [Novosphingobium sp.]|nr:peptidylprolyl isomerase [Novosphingobium sp.]